jgi:Protein of unknown function (DUF4230)
MSNDLPPTQPLTNVPSPSPAPEIESPTGWPADPAPADRPKRPGFVAKRVSRWTGRAFWVASLAGVIVVLLLAITLFGKWPHIGNPFKTQTKDRSGPVLLVSIQDLARFEAASGNFQVIVDIQQDHKYIPDIILSDRSLFVANGSVDAYVDFSNVGPTDVITSVDRKTVTINLPAPQLEPPSLDNSRSYVYAESSGLINKVGNLFGGDPNKAQELYLYADQKIAAAAVDSQLADRAETNTKAMLNELLRSLGFTTITVNFAAA